jgi:hypothetical protein
MVMTNWESGPEFKILTDSGCGIPIISEQAMNRLALKITWGPAVRVHGIGSTPIITKAYVLLNFRVSPELNQNMMMHAVVLPNTADWAASLPRLRPPWLKRVDTLLADADVADENIQTTHYQVLAGGSLLAKLKVNAFYFHEKFAMQDSVAGYIPRGTWEEEYPPQFPEDIMLHNPKSFMVNSSFRFTEKSPHQPVNIHCMWATATTMEDLELNTLIEEYLKRDRVDLLQHEVKNPLEEKEIFQRYLDTLLQKTDGRVIAPLPKQPGYKTRICANHRVGHRRGMQVIKFLSKNDKYSNAYQLTIDEWLAEGILVETDIQQLQRVGPYSELPHHAVIRPDSASTPVRLVIEGNAKDPGAYSTNDWLSRGVNVLPLIPKIITQLRHKQCFVVGDVAKAFLQVQLADEDQWHLVIRWPVQLSDGNWKFRYFRFLRLPFGISPAPFVLNAVLRFLYRNAANASPEHREYMASLEIMSYVDDLVADEDLPEDTVSKALLAEEVLAGGQFKLGKWRSYPPELASQLGGKPTLDQYKILGCGYDPKTDSFHIPLERIQSFSSYKQITKRQASGIIARFHDPLGLAAPVHLKGKVLRQNIDIKHPNIHWDFKLTQTETKKWHELVADWTKLKDYHVPRLMVLPLETAREYHCFADASGTALGAVIYCVSKVANGQSLVSLVTSKSKIIPKDQVLAAQKKQKAIDSQSAPVQNVIPAHSPFKVNKAELNSAVLLARLLDSVKERLEKSAKYFYWMDSEVALRWIRNGPFSGIKYHDARIEIINQLCPLGAWNHVPGSQNPADIASRGVTADELMTSDVWLTGPTWLANPNTWPTQPADFDDLSVVGVAVNKVSKCVPKKDTDFLHQYIFGRYDDWDQCALRYALFLRLKKKIQQMKKNILDKNQVRTRSHRKRDRLQKQQEQMTTQPESSDTQPDIEPAVSVAEFYRAELLLLRHMQQEYEPNLWKTLQKHPDHVIDGLAWSNKYQMLVSRSRQSYGKPIVGKDGKKAISPQLYKDLIHIPYTNGDKNFHHVNPAAVLLMRQAHLRTNHGAARPTLNMFRTRYWVQRGQLLAKLTKKRCPYCLRLDAEQVVAPPGPLPEFRCSGHKPFEAIGLDFLGPLQVLEEEGKKVHIAVITCTLTRAVIMRPVTDTGAEALASTLNTFLYDRDYAFPKFIVTDNAKAFECVCTNTLKANKKLLKTKYPQTTWYFNASRAPWWGGFFERIMTIIKEKLARCFMRVHQIYKNLLRFTEACALVQNMINSRPMSWMSEDPECDRHPVCPAIFLNFYTPYNFSELNPYHYGPSEQIFYAAPPDELQQQILNQKVVYKAFWEMFYNCYVSELRAAHSERKQPNDHLLKVGMVVLYKPIGFFKKNSPGEKRKWKLARICKLHPSKRDGHVRAVDIAIYDPTKDVMKILKSQSIRNIAILEAEFSSPTLPAPFGSAGEK